MKHQCSINAADELRREVVAWEKDRNERGGKIHWAFSITTARHKMKKTYPPIEI